MPYAQYDILTGQIHATVDPEVTGEASLAQLKAQGRAQVYVPPNVDGGRYKINLKTMQPELLANKTYSSDTIQFDLITPEKKFFSGQAAMVVVPGLLGDFGVLPGHAPFISAIRPGVITIDAGGEQLKLAITGGFAEVVPSRCTVLSETALDCKGLTTTDVQKQISDAKDELQAAENEEQRKTAETKLALGEALLLAI